MIKVEKSNWETYLSCLTISYSWFSNSILTLNEVLEESTLLETKLRPTYLEVEFESKKRLGQIFSDRIWQVQVCRSLNENYLARSVLFLCKNGWRRAKETIPLPGPWETANPNVRNLTSEINLKIKVLLEYQALYTMINKKIKIGLCFDI